MDIHGVFGNFIIIVTVALGILLLVGWTVKSVIAIEVTKRYELFQRQLQMEVTQTLERFRKALADEKLIVGAMMDCRSDTLVRLYGILIEIAKNGSTLSKPDLNNLPFAVGLAQSVQASSQEFFNEYQKSGVYFSDEFCVYMDTFMKKHEKIFADINAVINTRIVNPQDEQKAITDIQQGWSAFEMDIPLAISEMKLEFRRLVGGSVRW